MKKKETAIVLLSGLLFLTFIVIFSIIGNTVFKTLSNNKTYLIYVSICLGIVLIETIVLLYINYRDIKLVDKTLEKEYRKNNSIEYYSDKIKNYSPGVLAYCNSKLIDYKKVFIATILNLSQRKYIEITDDNITVLNKDYSDLEENEIFIMNAIDNKSLPDTYKNMKNIFLFLIKKDAEKKSVITKIKNFDKYYKISGTCITIFVIFTIGISFLNLFGTPKNGNALKGILTYFENFLVAVIFGFSQSLFFKHAYKKTDKGIELSVKTKCLKKFISEFTDLKNQTIKSIKIWDDYIIYVLLLDEDGQINKEVNLFYKKYLK